MAVGRGYAVLIAALLLIVTGCAAVSKPTSTARHSTSTSTPRHSTSTTTTSEDDLGRAGAPTVQGSVAAPGSGGSPVSASCRSGNPLANVYHPDRLQVVQPCVTVSGTVESVRHEDDGDYHFDLSLDPPFTSMLTAANTASQHGWLVVEIVPADEPGCTPGQPPKPPSGTYDYGICTGADEVAPAIGAHVYVTGPSVLDEDHGGWAEVHPAWAIANSLGVPATTAPPPQAPPSTAPPAPAPVPAPPPTTAAPTGCFPRTSSGNCYEAGEYCPTADHGVAGVAGNGQRIQCIDNSGWRWEAG